MATLRQEVWYRYLLLVGSSRVMLSEVDDVELRFE